MKFGKGENMRTDFSPRIPKDLASSDKLIKLNIFKSKTSGTYLFMLFYIIILLGAF